MKKQLLLLLFVTLIINSCSKNNELQPSSTAKSVLLRESDQPQARPFEGSMLYHLTTAFNLPCNCGPFQPAGSFFGTGNLSHLGFSTSKIKACFAPIFSGPNLVGLYTGHECASFVAANNDELYLDTQPYNLFFASNGSLSGTATIDFVGGTGRFTNATGSFTATVTIDPTGTIGTLTNINGTITY